MPHDDAIDDCGPRANSEMLALDPLQPMHCFVRPPRFNEALA